MCRVLLIDDDAAVGAAVKLVLELEDHAVTLADSGQAGLALLANDEFDVAIVDMFMPGLGGLETMSLIRQRAPALPIIATSGTLASGGSDVLAKAAGHGAATVIHKPFRPRDLLAAIQRCLGAD